MSEALERVIAPLARDLEREVIAKDAELAQLRAELEKIKDKEEKGIPHLSAIIDWLKNGCEMILPPIITKAPSCSEYGAAHVHRRDRVYLATNYAAALLFAAGQRNGMVYECQPIGELEEDPDCNFPGTSFQCERARILRVVKPRSADIELARMVLMEGV